MFEKQLKQIAHRAAARIAGIVVEDILERTPTEDGHAHEAWLTAAEQLSREAPPEVGKKLNESIARHSAKRSNDPRARDGGFGSAVETPDSISLRIENHLDFVSVMEHGGTLVPIEPGGPKEAQYRWKQAGRRGPMPPTGELYGPRLDQSHGIGMLVWKDASGVTKRAFSRRVPAGNYVKKAVRLAKQRARQLGLKVVK